MKFQAWSMIPESSTFLQAGKCLLSRSVDRCVLSASSRKSSSTYSRWRSTRPGGTDWRAAIILPASSAQSEICLRYTCAIFQPLSNSVPDREEFARDCFASRAEDTSIGTSCVHASTFESIGDFSGALCACPAAHTIARASSQHKSLEAPVISCPLFKRPGVTLGHHPESKGSHSQTGPARKSLCAGA